MTDRYLSYQQVTDKIGLSRWTVQRMYRRGAFPKPIRLSDHDNAPVRFRESEIDAWMQARDEASS